MKILILFMLLFACISCNSNIKKEQVLKDVEPIVISKNEHLDFKIIIEANSYDSVLMIAVKQISLFDTISIDIVEQIIPKNEKEFLSYYNLLSSENSDTLKILFYKIDDYLFNLASEKNINIFELYIKMAEFVDGEYADSYFENVEIVISKHKQDFNLIYPKLNEECKRRLEEYY